MTLRVAVVGAGPAGMYVAEGLCFDKASDVRVDLIDRLPTPCCGTAWRRTTRG